MLRQIHHGVGVAIVLAVAACSSSTDPGELQTLGAVEFYGHPAVIDLPDTVQVAEAFLARVQTYGSGCERMGPTVVTSRADTLVLEPYDLSTRGQGLPCDDILKTFDHAETAAWPMSGVLTVLVRGIEQPGGERRRYVREIVVR